jgi:hypothetical protein
MKHIERMAICVALLTGTPAVAFGQWGALEVAAIGRATRHGGASGVPNALGVGGRVGIHLPWSVGLEAEYSTGASRTLTLSGAGQSSRVRDVMLSFRFTRSFDLPNGAAWLVGAGYGYHAFSGARRVAPRGGGPEGLLGLRKDLSDRVSVRLDGAFVLVPAKADAKPVPRPAHLTTTLMLGLSFHAPWRTCTRWDPQ